MMQSMSNDELEGSPEPISPPQSPSKPEPASRCKSAPETRHEPIDVVIHDALDSWHHAMSATAGKLFGKGHEPAKQREKKSDTKKRFLLGKASKPATASRTKSLPPMSCALAGSVQGWKAVANKVDSDLNRTHEKSVECVVEDEAVIFYKESEDEDQLL